MGLTKERESRFIFEMRKRIQTFPQIKLLRESKGLRIKIYLEKIEGRIKTLARTGFEPMTFGL